ncbi:MAG: phytoene desaturase family protein [Woeseiaceae bacterium]
MGSYDSIIIGAGHNGLVCAAYLAKSGQRVLLLEAAESCGGLAARREFHPGFNAPIAHSVSHFPKQIIDDLNLAARGFKSAASADTIVALAENAEHIVISSDEVSGTSADDTAAYQSYLADMQRFANALGPSWLRTMPRIGNAGLTGLTTLAKLGLKIRLLGKKSMEELLRIASLPMRDLMDETFADERLKAALSWDGLLGAKLAPRSPNSAVLTSLYRMTGERGDVNSLIDSLLAAATDNGVEIRTGSVVDKILVDGSEDGLVATGVRLSTGEKIEANRIISATDPKRTFISMVGVEYLDIGFTNRIGRLRCDGYVAKLHLALKDLPEFSGLPTPDGRLIMAPTMDAIEFAFDNAKYGELPENPVLEATIPTIRNASLAPEGQHILSAHVMYVPYKLKGGWTDAARQEISENAIDTIAKYVPGIRDLIIHQEFLTPADLEQRYRVTGGHWHHTEMAMDQMLMMRPTYEAAQYSTPIPGLYLCGAGCHPGGGLSGGAGHNAAKEILR